MIKYEKFGKVLSTGGYGDVGDQSYQSTILYFDLRSTMTVLSVNMGITDLTVLQRVTSYRQMSNDGRF